MNMTSLVKNRSFVRISVIFILFIVIAACNSSPGSSDFVDGDGSGGSGDGDTPPGDGPLKAVINPSRTECASPCTVVFSADKTTGENLDQHQIWSDLTYHWDFDTKEDRTYGHLYTQGYTWVPGDSAFEVGYAPVVSKTFFCETGTCTYEVGMRAQNAVGDYDDDFVQITVKSESAQWSAADTVCVSNTLDLTSDWTSFDKPCPDGAARQTDLPAVDEYDGRLVLLHRGDSWYDDQNNTGVAVVSRTDQSNFKVGYFGNNADPRPVVARVDIGFTNFSGPAEAPTRGHHNHISDAIVARYGWPSNIVVEGLRTTTITFGMSFKHIGVHDMDLDWEGYTNLNQAGGVGIGGGMWCANSDELDCANVPFAKGSYISKVDTVGSDYPGSLGGAFIGSVSCPMIDFLGIVDSRIRKSREMPTRIHGGWRMSIMRNFYRGQHHQDGKSKIDIRGCFDNDYRNDANFLSAEKNSHWNSDLENSDGSMRTRADTISLTPNDPDANFFHGSRLAAVVGNRVGDSTLPSVISNKTGELVYQWSSYISFRQNDVYAPPEDTGDMFWQDIVTTHNIGDNEPERDSNSLIEFATSNYATCVDNTYDDGSQTNGCKDSGFYDNVGNQIEIAPMNYPQPPGP